MFYDLGRDFFRAEVFTRCCFKAVRSVKMFHDSDGVRRFFRILLCIEVEVQENIVDYLVMAVSTRLMGVQLNKVRV